MQCARIESQVRIQMANEMDEQLQEMERMYNERALNDVSMTRSSVIIIMVENYDRRVSILNLCLTTSILSDLLQQAEQHELLANKKLDLLSKINLSQQTPRAHVSKDLEIESDEEDEEVEDDGEGEDEEEVENGLVSKQRS